MSAPVYCAARQAGTVNEICAVYLQATTTPFFGLQNIFASTVSASWMRSDATGVTSIAILSTAALGQYSSGNWRQVNSTLAPGLYQFGIPSAAFSSGRWALVSIYNSSGLFSPAPVYYEITRTDNQTYVSSMALSTAICRIYSDAAVTTAAGVLAVGAVGVSSFNTGLQVGVSSFNSRVGVSSFDLPVGVSSFNVGLQVGVSTFSSRVGVSSFNLDVGVSSINTGLSVGVSSFNSRVGVSSFNLPVGVSSFDVGLQVGVSSFSSRVGVSSFGIAVGVSSMQDKAGYGVSSVTDKSDYGVSSVTGLNASLLDASVASRLASAAYTAPDNANIANIQAKTSTLNYTVAGQVDTNILSVAGITVVGVGTSSNPWGPV